MGCRARAAALTWWRYTRRWESVCTLHGLTANLGERRLVPVLRSVQIGQHTDVLELRVVTSQSVADWQKRTRRWPPPGAQTG